mmetsp:Transcript_25497/g.52152  ORF Transcript_25497/g.52152 Transcript_25497/m.52152 type:complete len:318 (-) Transcript_25497:162-1115(-)
MMITPGLLIFLLLQHVESRESSGCGLGALRSPLCPLDAIPGCDCDASICVDFFANGANTTQACSFVDRSDKFESIVNRTGVPLCDALENSAAFRQTFGNETSKSFYSVGGRKRPIAHHPSGIVPVFLRAGTCDKAYVQQSRCPTNNTTETEGDTDFGVGIWMFNQGDVNGCSMGTYVLPTTMNKLRFTVVCASQLDETITTGYEDSLVVYADLGNDDRFLCDKDVATQYTPIKTSEDWIEPTMGRRWMCHDFADGGQTYSLMLMSLGRAPCSGPEPDTASSARKMFDLGRAQYLGVCGLVAVSLLMIFSAVRSYVAT